MNFIEVVVSEMGRGNFSLAILIVSIIQMIIMIKKR